MSLPLRAPTAAAFAGALTACLCAAAPARADGKAEAEAQRLFVEGRDAVARGDYAAGCPKFAQSLKLVRRAGTLLNLAQCEEHEGRLRSALDYWTQGAAELDPTDERMALARHRITDLDARLPRLTVRLATTAPAGIVVRVDGAPLLPEEIGQALPVDVGSHEVVLLVPGQPEQRLPVEVAERERKEIVLQVAGAQVAGAQGGGAGLGPRAAGPATADETRRNLGLVLGGVGVASLAVAGVTGLLIMSRDSRIQKECPDKECSSEGFDTIQGTTPLLIGNAVAWGIGLAGLGAGAWLFFTSGGQGAKATALEAGPLPGGGRVTLRRSF